MGLKLICEVIDDIQILTEEDGKGGKDFFIEGIFMQANLKNKNGRVYPMEVLEREVSRYERDLVKNNRAYGELGHPSGPTINLERVSHVIKSLRKEGTDFVGRAKIMDTPYGNIVKNLMKEGCKLGVSSRGMGSLRAKNGVNEVQDDYYLATAGDIVADPSAPGAFVEGIMEGREWIYNNGVFREVELETAKKQIDESVRRRETEKVFVDVFRKFVDKL